MTTCDPATSPPTSQALVIKNIPVTLDSRHYEINIALPNVAFDPVTNVDLATIKVVITNYPSPVNARPIQYDSRYPDASLFLA